MHWNREERRQEPIPWANLARWRAAIDKLSAVRRDYQLVVLLTGLRRMDAATIRWEHLDFEARTLHRPNPKGGADRAFTIPLSRACVEILERRRRENSIDAGWAFPTDALKERACDLCSELGLPPHVAGARIHLCEAKETADAIVSPHRLRDTYTSALVSYAGSPRHRVHAVAGRGAMALSRWWLGNGQGARAGDRPGPARSGLQPGAVPRARRGPRRRARRRPGRAGDRRGHELEHAGRGGARDRLAVVQFHRSRPPPPPAPPTRP